MHDDDVAECVLDATQRIVVETNLRITSGVGHHQLYRVAIPRTVGRVFMVIVRHHKSEIHILIIINNLHIRRLVVRTGPSTAVVRFKVHQSTGGLRSFGNRKPWVSQQLSSTPLGELAIHHNRIRCLNGRVEFFAWLDIVVLLARRRRGRQRNQRRFRRAFAEDESMGAQTTPASLARSVLVAVIDRHAQAELHPRSERLKSHRRFRQLDFIRSPLRGRIPRHHCCRAARTRLVHDNHSAQGPFNAAQSVIVQTHLGIPGVIGHHQLHRITIPRTVRRVFMVVVRHHKSEIHIIIVINDADIRGLVVRPRPRAAIVWLKVNVGPGRTRPLGDSKTRVGQHIGSRPLRQIAIQHDGINSLFGRVELLSGFNIIG